MGLVVCLQRDTHLWTERREGCEEMGGTEVGGVEDSPLVADVMVATNCTKHALLALHME